MHVLNAVLVLANLGLMVACPWLVASLTFLPRIELPWSVSAATQTFFDGAIELYLIFSFAWLVQQLIGLTRVVVNALRATLACAGRCVCYCLIAPPTRSRGSRGKVHPLPLQQSPAESASVDRSSLVGTRVSMAAIGEGFRTLLGVARPATAGMHDRSEAMPGFYARIHTSPLQSGSEGGGGLLLSPPHLKSGQGVPAARRVRASIIGLFSE
jgi:hypothetical protein